MCSPYTARPSSIDLSAQQMYIHITKQIYFPKTVTSKTSLIRYLACLIHWAFLVGRSFSTISHSLWIAAKTLHYIFARIEWVPCSVALVARSRAQHRNNAFALCPIHHYLIRYPFPLSEKVVWPTSICFSSLSIFYSLSVRDLFTLINALL
jgi:hypothetical protein